MIQIVTICGSRRFEKEMLEEKRKLERGFNIVHTPNLSFSQGEVGDMNADEIEKLHRVHYSKMLGSDYILIVNPGGYIGDDTKREIAYAEQHNLRVEYMVPIEKPDKSDSIDLSKVSDDDLIHEIERRVESGKIDINVEMCQKE